MEIAVVVRFVVAESPSVARVSALRETHRGRGRCARGRCAHRAAEGDSSPIDQRRQFERATHPLQHNHKHFARKVLAPRVPMRRRLNCRLIVKAFVESAYNIQLRFCITAGKELFVASVLIDAVEEEEVEKAIGLNVRSVYILLGMSDRCSTRFRISITDSIADTL